MVKKRPTIQDIALKANVSIATVSRVINCNYPVSETVKKRVNKIIKELGYVRNFAGKVLRTNERMDIGIIVPTIENFYFAGVILGAMQEAQEKGYGVLLCNSFRSDEIERKSFDILIEKHVSGIIYASVKDSSTYYKTALNQGIDIVTIDQKMDRKLTHVGFDFFEAGRLATDFLLKNNHRNIMFVSSPLTKKSRQEMFEGVKIAFDDFGLSFPKSNIIIPDYKEQDSENSFEFAEGKFAAKLIAAMDDMPTAVVALNDLIAIGLINGLQSMGIKIPEDISVIGSDNIEFSGMLYPPLTTIDQPAKETGRQAFRLLFSLIREQKVSNVQITMKPELILRKSVKMLNI